MPLAGFEAIVRDHEPDAIEINHAACQGGVLTIRGESDFAPGAYMTVSVDGPDNGSDLGIDPMVLEGPMIYNPSRGEYEFQTGCGPGLGGRRITISTDEGGAYNSIIE